MNSFVVHGAVVLVKIVAQMPAAAFQSAASPISAAAGVVLSVLQRPCPVRPQLQAHCKCFVCIFYRHMSANQIHICDQEI